MAMICPWQNAQPRGAKFPANMTISAMKGSDMVLRPHKAAEARLVDPALAIRDADPGDERGERSQRGMTHRIDPVGQRRAGGPVKRQRELRDVSRERPLAHLG